MVSVPRTFILGHLQPVKLILSNKISDFLIFILGLPFLIAPEEKMRKGIHPKMDETQGFQRHGHSN